MAEVAAAFAGFTALASVFGGQQSRSDPRRSAHILRGMIEPSLVVVLFSLLPLVLGKTPIGTALAWQISSGACSIAWLTFAFLYARKGLRLQRELKFQASGWFMLLMLLPLVLGNTMLLLTASGAVQSWAGGSYLVGLLCLLVNSGFSFVRFFFVAFSHATK
jgi:hypothetical protein